MEDLRLKSGRTFRRSQALWRIGTALLVAVLLWPGQVQALSFKNRRPAGLGSYKRVSPPASAAPAPAAPSAPAPSAPGPAAPAPPARQPVYTYGPEFLQDSSQIVVSGNQYFRKHVYYRPVYADGVFSHNEWVRNVDVYQGEVLSYGPWQEEEREWKYEEPSVWAYIHERRQVFRYGVFEKWDTRTRRVIADEIVEERVVPGTKYIDRDQWGHWFEYTPRTLEIYHKNRFKGIFLAEKRPMEPLARDITVEILAQQSRGDFSGPGWTFGPTETYEGFEFEGVHVYQVVKVRQKAYLYGQYVADRDIRVVSKKLACSITYGPWETEKVEEVIGADYSVYSVTHKRRAIIHQNGLFGTHPGGVDRGQDWVLVARPPAPAQTGQGPAYRLPDGGDAAGSGSGTTEGSSINWDLLIGRQIEDRTRFADYSSPVSSGTIAGNRYEQDIQDAVRAGLINGRINVDGTQFYAPDALITTGEFVNILARNLGAPLSTVDQGSVSYLAALGISLGLSPDALLTVEEIARLARQMQEKGLLDSTKADLKVLTDALQGNLTADSAGGITRGHAVEMNRSAKPPAVAGGLPEGKTPEPGAPQAPGPGAPQRETPESPPGVTPAPSPARQETPPGTPESAKPPLRISAQASPSPARRGDRVTVYASTSADVDWIEITLPPEFINRRVVLGDGQVIEFSNSGRTMYRTSPTTWEFALTVPWSRQSPPDGLYPIMLRAGSADGRTVETTVYLEVRGYVEIYNPVKELR